MIKGTTISGELRRARDKILRDRFDMFMVIRREYASYDDIATRTGFSIHMVRSTFTSANLKRVGRRLYTSELNEISKRVAMNSHRQRSDKAQKSDVDNSSAMSRLIQRSMKCGTSTADLARSLGKSERYIAMWYNREASRRYTKSAPFRSHVNDLMRDEIPYEDIRESTGLSMTRIREIRRAVMPREMRKRQCTGCAAKVPTKELTLLPDTHRLLCRTCLWGGNPECKIDIDDMLSTMRNNQRDGIATDGNAIVIPKGRKADS